MTKRICELIDTGAIAENALRIKEKAKGKKLIAVIKANAYGHGDTEVSRILEKTADMFAVATKDEALNLRQNGVEKDIIILSMIPDSDKAECIKNGIILTASDLSEGKRISEAASEVGKQA